MACHVRAVDPAVPDWDLVPVHTPPPPLLSVTILLIFRESITYTWDTREILEGFTLHR